MMSGERRERDREHTSPNERTRLLLLLLLQLPSVFSLLHDTLVVVFAKSLVLVPSDLVTVSGDDGDDHLLTITPAF